MTSPSSLYVNSWYEAQYRRATSCGMWYLALKASIFAGESTKYLTYPFGQTTRKRMKFQGKEYELEGRGDQPRRNEPRKRRNIQNLTLVVPLVLLKGLNFKRRGARNLERLRKAEDLRVGSLWKSLRTCEMRKVISLGTLYRRWNSMGAIPLKI